MFNIKGLQILGLVYKLNSGTQINQFLTDYGSYNR